MLRACLTIPRRGSAIPSHRQREGGQLLHMSDFASRVQIPLTLEEILLVILKETIFSKISSN